MNGLKNVSFASPITAQPTLSAFLSHTTSILISRILIYIYCGKEFGVVRIRYEKRNSAETVLGVRIPGRQATNNNNLECSGHTQFGSIRYTGELVKVTTIGGSTDYTYM